MDAPRGKRPFRIHVGPAHDGADLVNTVGDRIRTEFYRRIGLEDLLTAHSGEGQQPPNRRRPS